MRLDKYLCHSGLGTRKDVKNLLKNKLIKVNNETVTSPSIIINEERDVITYNDEKLEYREFHYYILYKPKGYITATEDLNLPTVMDLIHEPYSNLSPVGRLDKDTTGLLLITNNGKLNHFLLSPKTHVDKEYQVTLDKDIDSSLISIFKEGVVLEDGYKCLSSELTILNKNSASVILHEGKYHQIKRMFQVNGYKVINLHRNRMDFLTLDGLKEGEYRSLNDEEIIRLLEHIKS